MHIMPHPAALAATLLLATATAASAAPDPVAVALESHVRFLADDALEGRGIGTRGHEITARYIATHFAGLGLQPAGDGTGTDAWFQRINFAERRFTSAKETISYTRGADTKEWTNGAEVTLSPGNAEGTDTITAPIVFAGFGIYDERLGINDFAGLDLKGKIVVTLIGAHPGLDSEVGAHLGRTSKATAALKAGAIGLIQVRTFAEATRLPFAKSASRARMPVRGLLTPDGQPMGDGAGLQVRGVLDDGPAVALFQGAPMSFGQVLDAAVKGPVKGFDLAGTLTIRRAQSITRISSPNVLAMLPGSDRKLAGDYVLISGHSDHLGRKLDAAPGADDIFNGAMDNASGTATLLEVARAITKGKRPRRSILFLATTAEESGLLGADYFSRRPTMDLRRVVAAVNIDMPILSCNFGDVIAFGAQHSTMITSVAAAARAEKLSVSPDPQPEEAIFTRSDHYPLVRAGIPAVFLKTGGSDAKGGNSCIAVERDFRLNRYHEVNDDMSQAFDWDAAAKFTRVNTGIVRRIADARGVPLWYAGDYFGETFAPAAPKAKR